MIGLLEQIENSKNRFGLACEHALSSCQSSFSFILISPIFIVTETLSFPLTFEPGPVHRLGLAGLVSPPVWSELLLLPVGGFDVFELLCEDDYWKSRIFYTSPTGNIIISVLDRI